MRLTLTAIALASLLPFSALAQQPAPASAPCANGAGNCQMQNQGNWHNRGAQQGQRQSAFASLNLTAEQQAAFTKEKQESWKKFQELNNQYPRPLNTAEQQKFREASLKLQNETQQRLRALLTPEQQVEFDKLQNQGLQRQNNRGNNRHYSQNGRMSGNSHAHFAGLNLTTEQQAAFDKELQANWQKRQEIRNKYPRPMSDEQRAAMRDENTKLSAEVHQRLRALLNTDQQAEFDKIVSQRRVDNTQRMMQRQAPNNQ